MGMQILIVDENDNPIGAEDIDVAIANEQFRRAAKVILMDREGKLLLQKRSSTIFNYPNCWDASAGGAVDPGEDYMDAVIRETREELGINISKQQIEFLGKEKSEFTDERGRFLRMFFGAFLIKADFKLTDFRIDPKEVAYVEYLSLDEIQALISQEPASFTKGCRGIFERYRDKLNPV